MGVALEEAARILRGQVFVLGVRKFKRARCEAFEEGLNFRVAAPSGFFEGAEGLLYFFYLDSVSKLYQLATRSIGGPKGATSMTFFYEIRSADNTVLKRDGVFASQDAAKIAARDDAKKMKNMRQSDRPDVGRILVGQNTEKATR